MKRRVCFCLITCCAVFLRLAFLVEQNDGDQDDHRDHYDDEGLQRLIEADDLQR